MTTEQRVRAEALRLFATRGFEATGIRDIARAAGISLATLYHYMDTKEDLLMSMLHEGMSALLGLAEAELQGVDDPAAQIAALISVHVHRHGEHRRLHSLSDNEVRVRSLSPDRRAELVALRDAYEAFWLRALRLGVATGRFRVPDAKLAVYALLEMCTGVAHWYRPEGRLSLDEISSAFTEMAFALLHVQPSEGPTPELGALPPRVATTTGAEAGERTHPKAGSPPPAHGEGQ